MNSFSCTSLDFFLELNQNTKLQVDLITCEGQRQTCSRVTQIYQAGTLTFKNRFLLAESHSHDDTCCYLFITACHGKHSNKEGRLSLRSAAVKSSRRQTCVHVKYKGRVMLQSNDYLITCTCRTLEVYRGPVVSGLTHVGHFDVGVEQGLVLPTQKVERSSLHGC